MKGFVYIMSNESMPGIFKIGCTSRRPDERANDLYTTGVPKPFVIEYCIYIEDYQMIERLIHIRLSPYNYNKEFFKHDLVKCILELKDVAIQKSSYKEKYINQHLRSRVEGWEYRYLQEKELEARRIKKEKEEREAQELRLRREVEIKRKEEDEKNKKGCTILIVSFIIGAILGNIKHDIWTFIIIFGIGFGIMIAITKDGD